MIIHAQGAQEEISKLEVQLLEVERAVVKQTKALMAHWRGRVQGRPPEPTEKEIAAAKPIVLRRRRENTKISDNWDLLFYRCYQDHQDPDLIWNYKTREELRNHLENEIRVFTEAVSILGDDFAAWNHAEFEVRFPSLENEIKDWDVKQEQRFFNLIIYNWIFNWIFRV